MQLSLTFGILRVERKKRLKDLLWCLISVNDEKRNFEDSSLSNKNVFDFYFLFIAIYKRNGG